LFSPPHTRRSGMCRFCLFFRWFFICSWFYLLFAESHGTPISDLNHSFSVPLPPTSEVCFWLGCSFSFSRWEHVCFRVEDCI
jgi:hypothetical protein